MKIIDILILNIIALFLFSCSSSSSDDISQENPDKKVFLLKKVSKTDYSNEYSYNGTELFRVRHTNF